MVRYGEVLEAKGDDSGTTYLLRQEAIALALKEEMQTPDHEKLKAPGGHLFPDEIIKTLKHDDQPNQVPESGDVSVPFVYGQPFDDTLYEGYIPRPESGTSRDVTMGGVQCEVTLWDTGGTNEHPRLAQLAYTYCDVAVFLCDGSVDSVDKLLEGELNGFALWMLNRATPRIIINCGGEFMDSDDGRYEGETKLEFSMRRVLAKTGFDLRKTIYKVVDPIQKSQEIYAGAMAHIKANETAADVDAVQKLLPEDETFVNNSKHPRRAAGEKPEICSATALFDQTVQRILQPPVEPVAPLLAGNVAEMLKDAEDAQRILASAMETLNIGKVTDPGTKSKDGCIRKAEAKYNRNYRRVKDAARIAGTLESCKQIKKAWEAMKTDKRLKFVEFINRFSTATALGYRDFQFLIEVSLPSGRQHVAELQLLHSAFADVKSAAHIHYEKIRVELPRLCQGMDGAEDTTLQMLKTNPQHTMCSRERMLRCADRLGAGYIEMNLRGDNPNAVLQSLVLLVQAQNQNQNRSCCTVM
eukprot:gene23402-21822_t